MRHYAGTVCILALSSTLSLPSNAQFTVLNRQQWTSATTSVLPITAKERASISGVSSQTNTLSFGTVATVNEIGSNQVVWGSNSELVAGDVVATFCGDVPTKMFWSFSSAVCGFGFEVMNNDLHEAQDFTISYYNGSTLLGSLTQKADNAAFWENYDYFAGDVRLFAVEDFRGITGLDILFTSNSMSASAFRVKNCSPEVVPEPAPWGLGLIFLTGIGGLLARRSLRRCHNAHYSSI